MKISLEYNEGEIKMRQKLIITIVSAIVGSALTLVGKPYINKRIEERKVPILVKEVYIPDMSSLPLELKRQVTLLPVKYTLEHKAGGTAKNVSILVNSDSAITPSEIKFSKWFEDYTTKQIDKNSIRIDIPIVRAGSTVTFELLSQANSKIQFQELVEVGRILSVERYQAQLKKSDTAVKVGIVVIILIWILLIGIIIFFFQRVRTFWQGMDIEQNRTRENIRQALIKFIIIIMVYNIIRGSFGPISGFLPLPYFSFSSFFYAFCLYLIVTRYKLLEDVLKKIVQKTTPEGQSFDQAKQEKN
jgi:hypothetical protein